MQLSDIKKFQIKISDIVALVLVFINLIGFRTIYNNYIFSILSITWIIMSICEKRVKIDFIKNKVVLCFILFLLYSILTSFISRLYSDAIKINMSLLYTYFSIIIFYSFLYNKNFQMIKIMCIFSICLIIFTSIIGIILFSFDKDISALVISHRIPYHFIPFGHLLGSYFSLAIISTIAISLIFKANTSAQRIIIVFTVAICILGIYKVRSSLTLIISILGVVLSILFNLAKKHKAYQSPLYLIIIILLSSFIIITLVSPDILTNVLDNLIANKTSKLSSRLNILSEIMKGTKASLVFDGTNNRFNQLAADIKAFLASPVIGYNHLTAGNESLLVQLNLGMHSQLFDYLAQFGLLGFIPYILTFIIHISALIKSYNKYISNIWIIVIILLMIVNPFRDFVSIHTLFFIVPSIFILLGASNIEDIYNYTSFSK